MKIREPRPFYLHLSILSLLASILLIIRRLINLELSPWNLLTGFFWPIIGLIIFIKFLKQDGYAFSLMEGLFICFIGYCALYFTCLVTIDLIVVSLSILFGLNLIIASIGWLGILYYVFL